MTRDHNAFAARERGRWLLPDAERWLQPDAHRFLRADWRDTKYWNGSPPKRSPFDLRPASRPTPPRDAEIDTLRREHIALRALVAEVRRDLAGRELAYKYRPDQPRVPAGNPDGGQWTSEHLIPSDRVAIDVSAARKGRGHHYVARNVFRQKGLPDDTRKVLEEATTGPLLDRRSNKYDRAHRIYNLAVDEAFETFVEKNGIDPSLMTPGDARRFVDEIKNSKDPRIRNFNMNLMLREIMKRLLRGPRGND